VIGRDVLYMLAALAVVLVAVFAPRPSGVCHESPRGEQSCTVASGD
jgi:hypothetical protein